MWMRYLLATVGLAVAVAVTAAAWRRSARRHERRDRWRVGLRATALVLLVGALTEPVWRVSRARISVVALVDISDSVRDRSGALDALQAYILALPRQAQVAVAAFGAVPVVLEPFTPAAASALRQGSRSVLPLSAAGSNATALDAALALAADMLPPDGDRRILLVSDGEENRGDAIALVPRLRAEGIAVTALSLAATPVRDVRVLGVRVPPVVRPGALASAEISLYSAGDADAALRVHVNAQTVYQATVRLRGGLQSVSVPVRFPAAGEARVDVHVESEGDKESGNNAATAFAVVSGALRALYVSSDAVQDTAAWAALRRVAGAAWERVGPESLPASEARLSAYDSVVFDDISAEVLTDTQMAAVARYVEEGGGWLTLGGPNAYGAGRWEGTPLEDAAPVAMTPQERRKPLALALLVDKSGSMAHEARGAQKLALAVRAAEAAFDALREGDHLAVIAFDAAARVLSPLRPATDRGDVLASLGRLRPGSGTDIPAALDAARGLLAAADFPRKQALLLSDGQSEGDLVGEAARLAREGVRLSTVAVGPDARPVLAQMAAAAGGAHYPLDSLSGLPRVLLRETRQPGEVVVQKETPVVAATTHDMVRGAFAPVLGYVATEPKESAEVFLRTREGDPILCGWRVGLGKALAFLSDGGNRWTRAWTRAPEFGARWESWFRWTLPQTGAGRFDVSADVQGSVLRLRVGLASPRSEEEAPTVRVRTPTGAVAHAALEDSPQGATATLPLEERGVYDVSIVLPSGDSVVRRVSYEDNAELVGVPDAGLLERLASQTGGAVAPDPAGWARRRGATVPDYASLAPWLLVAGIAVAVGEWVVRRFGWGTASTEPRRTAVEGLLAARARARAERHGMGSFRAGGRVPPVGTDARERLRRLSAARERAGAV
jgi:secreted protein with Ig-like and vWFA domain